MPPATVCCPEWQRRQAHLVRGVGSLCICEHWNVIVRMSRLCRQHAPHSIQEKVQRLLDHQFTGLHRHTIDDSENIAHAKLLGWHMRTLNFPSRLPTMAYRPWSSLCVT